MKLTFERVVGIISVCGCASAMMTLPVVMCLYAKSSAEIGDLRRDIKELRLEMVAHTPVQNECAVRKEFTWYGTTKTESTECKND